MREWSLCLQWLANAIATDVSARLGTINASGSDIAGPGPSTCQAVKVRASDLRRSDRLMS